jgi:hypothetical protein
MNRARRRLSLPVSVLATLVHHSRCRVRRYPDRSALHAQIAPDHLSDGYRR